MQMLSGIGVVILGYILGSIPFGLLIVKMKTGKDVRNVESGRTGGTNVVRAAGFGAGLLTATLDILKGATSVWVAQALLPGSPLDPRTDSPGCHPGAQLLVVPDPA